MKKMTYILIPFKSESARLMGKNLMLLPFTLKWIEEELSRDNGLSISPPFGDSVKIYTFGCVESKFRKAIESYGVEHVKLKCWEDNSHIGALQNTIEKLGIKKHDRIIQLQLT